MKLYILPKGVWVASHVLIILSLIFATVSLHPSLPHGAAGLATAALWCLAGALCVVFSAAFRKLAAKNS